MIPQLIDALERQADKGLLELLDARATIKVLEARNRELQEQNRELHEQLEAHKHAHVTAGRRQGLAALMARRPRHHTSTSEPGSDTPHHDARPQAVPSEGEPLSASPPAPSHTPAEPAHRDEPPPASASDSDMDQGPQSRLPIGEAPSPQALLDEWYHRYTETFFKGHTRPLKVGIHEDLVAREPWPEKLVRRALACYVHLPRYLKAVRAGAERVGLDGESAGVVTEGEAKYARKQLDDLQAQNRTRQAKRRERQRQQEKEERLEKKISELLAKHER
ncbi:ProQ/FINO family protein [Litchfieldella qijiaojingensis]|uniref:ProQ/FINO family protein n=1 Tax=Litchfieldella qijiaojingensis TaxID=980347 RepID=UPI001672CBB5|nr:ProQ/FINO family protein [Halomonas qijiaojingensis]